MRVTYTNDKKACSYEWDSFDEWYEEFKTWVKTPEGERHYRAHSNCYGGSERWFGHPDGFHGTLKAIDSGWTALREKLCKMVEGIELDLPVYPSVTMMRRRKKVWTDMGDELNQERLWNGQLETAWRKPVRTERLAPNIKRVTLAFDVSDNGYVSNDMAMWRAAVSMLLCESLARAGRVFEIWCIDSTSRPFQWGAVAPNTLWSGWMIKGSGEPMVIDRLAGMLGVGFLRTVGFMAQGMGPHLAASGMGSALHVGLPHTLEERRKGGEVVIRIAGCYTRQEALNNYKLAWEEVERLTGKQEEAA
jgi:hypothetical protein